MAKGFYRDVKRILKKHGCRKIRQAGAHEIWENPVGHHFTVSTNLKSRHTANAIMQQAGIDKAF